jgi:hypothetical protein
VTKSGVNVFCVVSSFKVYGPFFFAEPSVNYLDMLQLWLMPQVQHVQVTVTGNSWLDKEKWSVDLARGSDTKHIHAIFRHDYPLAVEPSSSPRPLVQRKLGEILYLLICSFLPCLSWFLLSRVRKSRRDFGITLYN